MPLFLAALRVHAGSGARRRPRRSRAVGRTSSRRPSRLRRRARGRRRPSRSAPAGPRCSLNGKSISDRRATFQVDANLRGTGFGGCNTFSAAAYPLRQQGFAVGPLALTKRACDKGMMDFERAFLLALRGARKCDLVDGRLVIKGAAGELRFDRASDVSRRAALERFPI